MRFCVGEVVRSGPRHQLTPVSRPKSWAPSVASSPSRTSASFAKEGAVADVSRQAPGLLWSTIAVRVRAPFGLPVHECDREVCPEISSKSSLILILSRSKHAHGSFFGIGPANLYSATEPLAHKPHQPRLERSAG